MKRSRLTALVAATAALTMFGLTAPATAEPTPPAPVESNEQTTPAPSPTATRPQPEVSAQQTTPASSTPIDDFAAVGATPSVGQATGSRMAQEAEALLGNQVPETVALAASARQLGAAAASAFGAGFGGSVWALVPRADAEGFAAAWLERYTRDFPARAATASTIVTEADRAAEPVVSRVSV